MFPPIIRTGTAITMGDTSIEINTSLYLLRSLISRYSMEIIVRPPSSPDILNESRQAYLCSQNLHLSIYLLPRYQYFSCSLRLNNSHNPFYICFYPHSQKYASRHHVVGFDFLLLSCQPSIICLEVVSTYPSSAWQRAVLSARYPTIPTLHLHCKTNQQ